MRATEILMEEHRVIERVLDALEHTADRLITDSTVRPGFFLEAADFLAGFADGCHHRKEEGVLFEAMVACGFPAEQGPIGVMLQEHEAGRALTRAIRESAGKLEQGDPQARSTLVASVRSYVALLRDHISKEDEVLFPLADRMIPRDRQDQVLTGFGRVEEHDTGPGTHQRFLELAERLERESGAVRA